MTRHAAITASELERTRRLRPPYLVAATLMIALLATVWSRDPVVLADEPVATIADPTSARPATANGLSAFADQAAFRLVPTTTVAPGTTAIVADPRPGDLRVDATADTLPVDYAPAPAATTLLDLPYGDAPAQRLDLHLPATDHAPVLLYLHSGGWGAGDKSAVPDMVMRFVERGYAVASMNYHLSPEFTFPTPVTDVKLAIRWLKASAERDGRLDGDRIVLVGASSGGHLAAFAAATPGGYEPADPPPELDAFDSSVVGVVSFVGPTDLVQLYDQRHIWARGITSAFMGCYPCTTDQLAVGSVADQLGPGLPPAYWAYGTEDPLVDPQIQGIAIAEAWAWHGGSGSSWLDLVEGAGHTLDASTINQRALETFVDRAIAAGLVD